MYRCHKGNNMLERQQKTIREVVQKGDLHMFRFGLKNGLLYVSRTQFVTTATQLLTVGVADQPDAVAEILTCEDLVTYKFSQVSFVTDEVTEIMSRRKSYKLHDLSAKVWRRSLKVELLITSPTKPRFSLWLIYDKSSNPRHLMFSGSGESAGLVEDMEGFKFRAGPFIRITDGFPLPSRFNYKYGSQFTGQRLE
jgi:hypothetical protein